MKTTLELPEDLVAMLETTAARQNRDLSEVAREALVRGLSEAPRSGLTETGAEQRRRAMAQWLHGWRELGAQIHAQSRDSRSMVEILRTERESRR